MSLSRQAYLSWIGTWLIGSAVLVAGIDRATAAALQVVCRPEQPVVPAGDQVSMRAWADAQEGVSLRYDWTVETGRVVGQGAEVIWNLDGVRQSPVPYKAEVRSWGPVA